MSETWTIGELAERAADALGPRSPRGNGRVREVPGERLIRWYTTIGLVDPPLTRRGRIARYGRRHLLQIVSVKRLQAAGHSIAEIQARLAGATDTLLESTARLGSAIHPGSADPTSHVDSATSPDSTAPKPPRSETARPMAPAPKTERAPAKGAPGNGAHPDGRRPSERERFWTGGTTAVPASAVQDTPEQDIPERGAPGRGAQVSARVGGIRLADGAVLVLRGAPTDDDIGAVLAAAGPLLQVLEERNLT
jgi:DNA-binding transcriptional MerR regulator